MSRYSSQSGFLAVGLTGVSDRFARACGPTALSTLTGESRRDAAIRLARFIKNKRGENTRIQVSTRYTDLRDAIVESGGFRVTIHGTPMPQNPEALGFKMMMPTVAQWLRRPGHQRGTWIILAADHFVTYHDGEVLEDNGYDPRRGRVVRHMKIEPADEDATFIRTHHPERKGSRVMSVRIYKSAQALIDQHDIDPADIDGTGSGGAITKADVKGYLESRKSDSGGGSNRSQQDVIRAGLEQGLSNKEIVQNVKAEFPDSGITRGDVSWTIGNERRNETDWWAEYGPKVVEDRGVKLEA